MRCRHLYTNTAVLEVIRWRTGSQLYSHNVKQNTYSQFTQKISSVRSSLCGSAVAVSTNGGGSS